MTKVDLKSYYAWFMEVLPQRILGLEAALRESAAPPGWNADTSAASLDPLGNWFASQIEVRPRTREEIEEVSSKLALPIEVSPTQLTNRTFSLAMDVGMYFSQIIMANLAGTYWDQPLRNPKFADYGQPVIMGFGSVPLNPVRVMVSTAYGLARDKPGGARLGELYGTWAKMHKP